MAGADAPFEVVLGGVGGDGVDLGADPGVLDLEGGRQVAAERGVRIAKWLGDSPSDDSRSATSSSAEASAKRSGSPRSDGNVSRLSAWVTICRSPRPSWSCTATWQVGSSRPPNFERVRRTPLATARTWPCPAVSSARIRSASPSFQVRSTTASSR